MSPTDDSPNESQRSSEPPSVRVTATAETPVVWSLAVEVDARRVDQAIEREYRKLGRGVRVKGFRPGKAPRSVLERLYGASMGEQLEQTLVAETLGEALEQSGLQPVAEPTVESEPPVAGAPFAYNVRVEVKPTIALPDLDGLPAIRPAVDVSDEEIDEQLEALRKRNAHAIEEPEDTRIEEGHLVTIDYVGRVDGQPFEGGTGKDVEVEVGSERFIPGFEDQLVGARSGDDVEVRVTFPERYGNRELAGKEAVFACHVAAVKKRELAELDDEFAKDLGDFETLDALRQRIRDDLLEARERESKEVLRRSLLDALLERSDFVAPPGLVEHQLARQLQAARERLLGQAPEEDIDAQLARWSEQWRDGAEREVREMLVLEAVAEAHDIEVEDAEVDARIQEMAGRRGAAPGAFERVSRDEAFRRALRSQLRDEKVLDFLVGRAKVEEKTDS